MGDTLAKDVLQPKSKIKSEHLERIMATLDDLHAIRRAICLAISLSIAMGVMAQNSPVVMGSAPASSTIDDPFRSAAERLNEALIAVVALGSQGPIPLGTGFFVAEDGTFLTAAHVLDHQTGIVGFRAFLPFSGLKRFFRFEVVELHRDSDVAICRLVPDGKPQDAPHFGYLRLAKSAAPQPGVMVATAGFPLKSTRPVFQFGMVASFPEATQLQIGIMLNDGDSGAPVIEVRSGALIGMVVSVRTTELYDESRPGIGQQNTGLSWVLPVSVVAPMLEPTPPEQH
jgi:hypothetical protein